MGISQLVDSVTILIILLISINPDPAQTTEIAGLACPFTDGLCNWSDDTNSWRLGSYHEVGFGKPSHPIRNGSYVYADDNPNHFNQLVSPVLDDNVTPFCLEFAYYMFGPEVDQLSLRLIDTEANSTWVEMDNDVWTRKGSQVDDWFIGRYHFDNSKSKAKVKIAFVTTTPDIAIGPIKATSGSCAYNDLCDFEDLAACFWTIEPDYQSNFAWYLSDGKTSDNLLFREDTTTSTESGKYLRTPSEGPVDARSALITKFKLNSSGAKCLSFNLFKPAQDSDLVEISFHETDKVTESKFLWTSSSIKGELEWQPIHVNLPTNETNFQDFNLFVTAHKHTSGDTAIAIDDLRVSAEPCAKKIDCTFDNANCMIRVTLGPFLVGFGRLSNSEALKYSLTSFKNNDPDDFFIYTDSPAEPSSVKYSFESPIIPKIDLGCLSFSYFIDMIDPIANYLIEINVQSSTGSSLIKFEPHLTFGNWSSIEFILSTDESFKIQFSLTTESKMFAAFDDIQLVEGQCGSLPDQPTQPSTIILSEPFNNQSDWEVWVNWNIVSYAAHRSDFPIVDPFGEGDGKFLGLSSDEEKAVTAVIGSEPLESGFYCLSLWFWCVDPSYDTFAVTIDDTNATSSIVIIENRCEVPKRWLFNEATFHSNDPYQIKILGDTKSQIAVDQLIVFNGPCSHDQTIEQTCTFDDGTDCGIKVETSSFYNWRIEQGAQLANPIGDHSTQTLNGRSMVLQVNPKSKVNSTSYFYLANLRQEDSYCVSFWYLIEGNNQLKVWKTERDDLDSLSAPLAIYDNTFGSSWLQVFLQIDSVQRESDVVFGGSYYSGSTGFIAVDDLKVSQGECRSSGICDGDPGCDWVEAFELHVTDLNIDYESGSTRWTIGQASQAKAFGYPRKDHTFEKAENSYGYVVDLAPGQRAILASPIIYLGPDESSICLQMAYAIEKDGLEVVIEQQEGQAYLYKNLQGYNLRNWNEVDLNIQLRSSPSRMVKVYLVSPEENVAFDDLSLTPGPCVNLSETFKCSNGKKIPISSVCDFKNDCPRGEDESECGSCDFKSDPCGYTMAGQTKWTVKNDQISLDTSRMIFGAVDKGSLGSPLIQETSSTCKLVFNYAKHPADSLTASLLMKSNTLQLWDSSISSGDSDWNEVTIELGRIKSPFKIVFAGQSTFRLFEYQHIAIKYVHLVDCEFQSIGSNETDVFTCSDGRRISLDQVCDSSSDCRQGEDEEDCPSEVYTFEQAILQPWREENSQPGLVSWTLTSGSGIISNRPTLDHTRRSPTGIYAFLDSPKVVGAQSALLLGPELNYTEKCRVNFYYYLSSTSMVLNVYLQDSTTSQRRLLLTKVEQVTDFGFKKVTLPLKSQALELPFRVGFAGQLKDQTRGSYLALDDISFSPGCYGQDFTPKHNPQPKPEPEPEPEPKRSCALNEFHCQADEKCISIEKTCNYQADCSDGQDERNCGSCDFAGNGLCGWANEGNNLWISMDREDAIKQGWPKTIQSPTNFLVATASASPSSAAIRSPLLGMTSSLCQFKFKYHLSNQTKLTMRIRQEQSSTTKIIEELEHHSADSMVWAERSIELTSLSFNHYIQFVLDTPPSDTFLMPAGLADFNLMYCDPFKVNFDAFNCNLDLDTCRWTDTGSKELEWTVINNTYFPDGTKFGFGSLSNHDHLHFLYLNISPNQGSKLIRTLTSPWQYATEKMCFTFDYRLLAFDETTFTLFIETPGSILRTLFFKEGEPNYGWNQASVTIEGATEFRLIFKAILAPKSDETVIALDNFALSSGPCSTRTVSCDFSVGFCDWFNSGWSAIKRQQVPSANNEYREYYLRHDGDRIATLSLKEVVKDDSARCLSFWYHHTFNATSELKVNSLEAGKIAYSETVPDHEMPNIWSYHRETLMIGEDFDISIEAKALGPFDTVGIDDITLYEEPCGAPGNCDFQYDTCGWQSKTVTKWRRNLGVTPSTDNAQAHHLLFDEKGWFMFVRTNDLSPTNTATLESVQLTYETPICLSFAYLFTLSDSAATGKTSNGTRILLSIRDTLTDSIEEIDSLYEEVSMEWKLHEKTIRSINPFRVLFTASSDTNRTGDMAIDDITFTPGKCLNDVDTTTLPSTTSTVTQAPETTTQAMPETVTPTKPEETTEIPTPLPSIDTHESMSLDKVTSLLTAKILMTTIRQNASLIAGIMVILCMTFLPMLFIFRNMCVTRKSFYPEPSVTMDNKIYDIYADQLSVSARSQYEQVDSPGPSAHFEMKDISRNP